MLALQLAMKYLWGKTCTKMERQTVEALTCTKHLHKSLNHVQETKAS
jgi:hypothetical protein